MRNTLMLIVGLITMSVILFVVFTKADYSKLTESEALEIGEKKYLEFLWLVDGAFNSERLNGDFIVNGKILSEKDKKFTCIYQNKKDNRCVGNNFEEEFNRVFASNITYNDVYGDDTFYVWIKNEKGKYIFSSIDSCSTSRMSLNQSIRLESIDNNKLVFNVASENSDSKNIKTKLFALIKEGNDWKISLAYYHDLCEMDYNIG